MKPFLHLLRLMGQGLCVMAAVALGVWYPTFGLVCGVLIFALIFGVMVEGFRGD